MRKVSLVLCFAVLLLCSFAGFSFAAAETLPQDGSWLDLAKPVLDAVVNGQYWIAVAAGIVFAVAMARRYVPATSVPGKLLASELGAMVCAALVSFFGAIATSLTALGLKMPTLAVFKSAGLVAFTAVGGWMILHKVASVVVATKTYHDKAPAWLKAVVSFVLAMIGSSAATKAEAKVAGDKAVEAKSAQGAEAIVGKGESF
jgi:hypothetical protein